MATVLLNIEKEIAADAAAVLNFVRGAEKKIQTASPAAIAGLGVLLAAVEKALTEVQTATGNPLTVFSIEFDTQTLTDIKAVWPDIKAFAETIGIKL